MIEMAVGEDDRRRARTLAEAGGAAASIADRDPMIPASTSTQPRSPAPGGPR